MKTKSVNTIMKLLCTMFLVGMWFICLPVITSGCKKHEEPVKEIIKLTKVNEFSTTPSDWVNVDGTWKAYAHTEIITPEIASSGMIMVYIQYGNSWVPLPDNNGFNQTTFSFEPSIVTVLNFNQDGTVPGNPGNQYFKVVCVPHQMISNPDLKAELLEIVNSK